MKTKKTVSTMMTALLLWQSLPAQAFASTEPTPPAEPTAEIKLLETIMALSELPAIQKQKSPRRRAELAQAELRAAVESYSRDASPDPEIRKLQTLAAIDAMSLQAPGFKEAVMEVAQAASLDPSHDQARLSQAAMEAVARMPRAAGYEFNSDEKCVIAGIASFAVLFTAFMILPGGVLDNVIGLVSLGAGPAVYFACEKINHVK